MGLVAGLGFGLGLLLAMQGLAGSPRARAATRRPAIDVPNAVRAAGRSLGAGVLAGALVLVITGIPVAAALAAAGGAAVPALARRRKRNRDRRAQVQAWPDAVEDLLTAVRAGVPLSEAICEAAVSGPEPLRAGFAAYAATWRRGGSFTDSLATMQRHFAEPSADRVVVSLALAAASGGGHVGRVLATQSDFLRADLRMRGEIEAKHSWTVSAARVSVAAPWFAVALVSIRGESAQAFATAAGAAVLLATAAIGGAAYWTMTRIAALPVPQRLPEVRP